MKYDRMTPPVFVLADHLLLISILPLIRILLLKFVCCQWLMLFLVVNYYLHSGYKTVASCETVVDG